LTNATLGNGISSLGNYLFDDCTNLTCVIISGGVTNIGDYAFDQCYALNQITIPSSVSSVGSFAFEDCPSLNQIFFAGNAPATNSNIFFGTADAVAYYLAGTFGWGSTFAGIPATLWNPQAQTGDGFFGIRTNRFGFNFRGVSNTVVVVEACTNLFSSVWQPIATNALTGEAGYFSDPQWTNYPGRYYRLRSPQ
jgi:hypothetical protein